MDPLYTTVPDEAGLGFWVVRDGRKLVRHTTEKSANKMCTAMAKTEDPYMQPTETLSGDKLSGPIHKITGWTGEDRRIVVTACGLRGKAVGRSEADQGPGLFASSLGDFKAEHDSFTCSQCLRMSRVTSATKPAQAHP